MRSEAARRTTSIPRPEPIKQSRDALPYFVHVVPPLLDKHRRQLQRANPPPDLRKPVNRHVEIPHAVRFINVRAQPRRAPPPAETPSIAPAHRRASATTSPPRPHEPAANSPLIPLPPPRPSPPQTPRSTDTACPAPHGSIQTPPPTARKKYPASHSHGGNQYPESPRGFFPCNSKCSAAIATLFR